MHYFESSSLKRVVCTVLVLLAIGLSAFAILSDTWKVDPDRYEVTFSGGKINGTFKGLKADIQFDKVHPEQSKISASIDAGSVSTGFFLKNSHAKDALGADLYPTISFTSTNVTMGASGYQALGKLTLKGVTKPATIYFTFDDKGNTGIFKGEFTINPADFKIDRKGTPAQVIIYLTVPVVK